MIKYQNYNHIKLPITINPLEYGKLLYKSENIYIIQVNTTNIAIIELIELFNEVKLYRSGDLILEYKDHKIDDSTFLRSLENKKFTFKDKNFKITQFYNYNEIEMFSSNGKLLLKWIDNFIKLFLIFMISLLMELIILNLS